MGALAAVGLATYRVSVELASTRVTVGDAALGQVVLTNPSARRVGASTVELPVGEGLAAFRVPRLGAGESHEEPFTIPTRRRGVVVVVLFCANGADRFGEAAHKLAVYKKRCVKSAR